MITVEITAAIDAAGTLKTFYFSTGRFQTKATDTPANTSFDDTLIDPGSVGINSQGNLLCPGLISLDIGEIVIANASGVYDDFFNYGFDGRTCVVRFGHAINAYPSAWVTVISGTIEAASVDFAKIVIRLRDKAELFNINLSANVYLGNNALPNGTEGGPELLGKVKPRIYGHVQNITPVLINTSKLVYQLSDQALFRIDNVYDKGVPLMQGNARATSDDLLANMPTMGFYDFCLGSGMIRLGSAPAGGVTCNAYSENFTPSNNNKVSVVMGRILQDCGIAAANIANPLALASLDAEMGIYINDFKTRKEILDTVCQSFNGFYTFKTDGKLLYDAFLMPLSFYGNPTVTAVILNGDIVGGSLSAAPAADLPIPITAINLYYNHNYTVQKPADLAGSVSADRQIQLGAEYQSQFVAKDTAYLGYSVSLKYTFAPTLDVKTDLFGISSSAIVALGTQLLQIYSYRRRIFSLKVSLDTFNGLQELYSNSKLLSVANMEMLKTRFKNPINAANITGQVIGYSFNLEKSEVILLFAN